MKTAGMGHMMVTAALLYGFSLSLTIVNKMESLAILKMERTSKCHLPAHHCRL